jgi:hypothetical protein
LTRIKTYNTLFHMFKRNQLEAAIAVVLEGRSEKMSSQLHSRMKRLLETDRDLGRNKRSADPERANFAFYSQNMPGRGSENWFSPYEAFALLTGLRLRRHGWPQRFVVALLRRIRPELEKEHTRILQQDAPLLFDEQLVQQQAQPGSWVVGNTDPVFLAIVSRTGESPSDASANPAAICRGQQRTLDFVRPYAPGQTMTTYELVDSVHALHRVLAQTRPRNRGRAASVSPPLSSKAKF